LRSDGEAPLKPLVAEFRPFPTKCPAFSMQTENHTHHPTSKGSGRHPISRSSSNRFCCLAFAVCQVAWRTYISSRLVCNADGPRVSCFLRRLAVFILRQIGTRWFREKGDLQARTPRELKPGAHRLRCTALRRGACAPDHCLLAACVDHASSESDGHCTVANAALRVAVTHRALLPHKRSKSCDLPIAWKAPAA
jgi:hypothetical protein